MFGIQKLKDRITSLELQLKNPAKYKVGDRYDGKEDLIVITVRFEYHRFEYVGDYSSWIYTVVCAKSGHTKEYNK